MTEKATLPSLPHLGKLAYCGSPTVGSVIVYAAEQKHWVRVPVQEICPPPNPEAEPVLSLLKANRIAQSMLVALVIGLIFMAFGVYRYTQDRIRATAHQAAATRLNHETSPFLHLL